MHSLFNQNLHRTAGHNCNHVVETLQFNYQFYIIKISQCIIPLPPSHVWWFTESVTTLISNLDFSQPQYLELSYWPPSRTNYTHETQLDSTNTPE